MCQPKSENTWANLQERRFIWFKVLGACGCCVRHRLSCHLKVAGKKKEGCECHHCGGGGDSADFLTLHSG